jgi:hypothetical protein
MTRLLELKSLVDLTSSGDAVTTRMRLIERQPNGRSLLEEFALASRPVRNVPLSTLTAGDLLAANAADLVRNDTKTPPRGAQLRGGRLVNRHLDVP